MDKNLMHYKIFSNINNIKAFTTCKSSFPKHQLMRFSDISSQSEINNRKLLADLLNIDPCQLIFPSQTHTNHVKLVTSLKNIILQHTDALVTNLPDVCLSIQTADCVPVLFY